LKADESTKDGQSAKCRWFFESGEDVVHTHTRGVSKRLSAF
jgi:hypothetical protein